MKMRSIAIGFCMSFLCGVVPASVTAQSPSSASPSASFKAVKSGTPAKDEVTVVGTIQRVLNTNPKGAPMGVYAEIVGPQGLISANLGPWLSSDVKQGLGVGQSVRMVGSFKVFQGQNYLLTRQLVFNNRQINIRNENGFLVRMQPSGPSSRQALKTSVAKGENQ